MILKVFQGPPLCLLEGKREEDLLSIWRVNGNVLLILSDRVRVAFVSIV